jgi:FtsP/CotA-like multicopper oxidase with cupredoxin domain
MTRRLRVLMRSVAAIFVLVTAWPGSQAEAQEASTKFNPAVRPEFHEPVTLASKDGVLEVRLIAKQGTASLDTVAKPVENMLVFAYELVRGTASDGKTSGDNLYPAPTLQVFPGETLIVHLDNALTGLTIKDFFDPAYTAKGEEVPLYPPQMTSSPLNLHTHGIHVSPKGNADNVLLHIPAGKSNTYTYNIPKSMPQGAYWYHSHLHTLTAAHVYYGRAARHRAHRRKPAAGDAEPDPDPQHAVAIQLCVRPGGRERAAQQLHLAAMGKHHQAAARR